MNAPMNRETVRARLPLNATALLLRLGGKDVGMATSRQFGTRPTKPLVRRIVAEPLLATADQRLVLSHAGVIDVTLATQILGPHSDRDFLTLLNVDNRQSFD